MSRSRRHRSDSSLLLTLEKMAEDDLRYQREPTEPFIFTKIPRTASTSMHQELTRRVRRYIGVGKPNRFSEILSKGPEFALSLRYCLNHMRVQVFALRDPRHRLLLRNHYCFMFVRNPWDRMASLWRLHCANDRPTSTNQNGRYFGFSFERFIDSFLAVCDVDDTGLYLRNEFRLGDSQWRWVHPWTDYIGRYETLQEDFLALGRILSWKDAEKPFSQHTKLHRKPPAQRRDYRELYSRELADRVGEFYAKDVELFGYSFDSFDESSEELTQRGTSNMVEYLDERGYQLRGCRLGAGSVGSSWRKKGGLHCSEMDRA